MTTTIAARSYTFNRVGGPEVLVMKTTAVPPPKQDEVRILVKAIGLNRAEIMYRSGQYVIDPVFPAALGYEAAGVVDAVGANVEGVVPGDAVSVIPAFSFAEYGMYGEVVLAPAHAIVKHPPALGFAEAAASWMMFVTAYGALIDIAGLSAGQTLVINAASSSVGMAAIQMANLVGATPIAITRHESKCAALREAGATAVIASETQDVVSGIQRAAGPSGVRVVFDPVGGPAAGRLVSTLGHAGTYILYGALDARDMAIPVMPVLARHLTVRGYELFEVTGDPVRLASAKRFIHDGLASAKLAPKIDRTFRFDDLPQAHEYLASNSHVGKVVVTCD